MTISLLFGERARRGELRRIRKRRRDEAATPWLSNPLSVSRLPYLVCDDLTGRHLGRVRQQGCQILRHELSRSKVRLLLGVLVLEDARRNHYPVPRVDEVVSDEARQLADDGDKALIDKLGHLLGLADAIVAPYRDVHSFYLPPSHIEGGTVQSRQSANGPSVKGCKSRRNFENAGSSPETSGNTPYT